MGRTSRPAPRAAPRAAPAAPPRPAAQQQQQQPQTVHVMHHNAPGGMRPGFGGGGPGLMGTMAAAAAGSMVGHGLSNAMYGSQHQQQQPVAPDQQQQPVAAAPAATHDPCKAYFEMYSKCMESTAPASCGWAWDEVVKCRNANMSA